MDLPLPVAPDYAPVSAELTQFLPTVNGSTQGKLVVDAELVQLLPDAFGYGYGYRGKLGGGKIKFTIRYIPPEIAGTYRATVTAFFDDSPTSRTLLAPPSTTEFKVVAPFVSGDVKALATMYPRGETAALSRDLVVLQAKVKDDVAPNVVSVTVDPGLLGPAAQEMDRNQRLPSGVEREMGDRHKRPRVRELLVANEGPTPGRAIDLRGVRGNHQSRGYRRAGSQPEGVERGQGERGGDKATVQCVPDARGSISSPPPSSVRPVHPLAARIPSSTSPSSSNSQCRAAELWRI